jgi:hypothetical protein
VAATQKAKNALEDENLVAGTQQNLSNLYSQDIYSLKQCAWRDRLAPQLFLSVGMPVLLGDVIGAQLACP